jgi:peptidoglycan/xylan/chitin deacetylase (PgdA/CDA1 family)
MKTPVIRSLRQSIQRLKRRFTPKSLILMYHRIAEVRSDPWALSVSPRHFTEHLEILREKGYPMLLQQLVSSLRDGDLPQRSAVITFDDGYADNLHSAKPLLERYDIPATFFITTGYIGHEREFWSDTLDRLLLQPGTLPGELCLSINGSAYQWKLDKSAHYTEEECRRHRGWRVWGRSNPNARHFLYRSLYKLLLPLREDERQKVLDKLLLWAGAKQVSHPTHRFLSLDEMFVLAQGKLIEIGSHTVTHPFLSAHSAAFQWDEIQRGKAYLENILGRPVTSFAYPHGDYSGETLALVREARFTCACSIVKDVVWRLTDCFQLPRVQVEDWDGEEFAKRLSWWLND